MMKRWGALAGVVLGFWCTIQTTVQASPAWFGASPDNSQNFVLDVIGSARKEILLNIYEFRHPLFTKAIIEQINKGITVKILVEGQPFATLGQVHSPMQPDTKVEVKAVWAAMQKSTNKNNKIFIMYAKDETQRRFVYDHAKYMVIDQARVYVSSENFSPSTAPETGRIGNRGWHILVEDKGLVQKITDLFLADSNPKEADIVDLSRDKFPPAPGDPTAPRSQPVRDVEAFPRGKGKVEVDTVLTSPNSDKALVDLIDSARSSVELEYASLPSFWKVDGKFADNPVFEALLAAAKRKVTVHMLLNDDESWGPVQVTRRQNLRAACLAQRIASGYKLPLTAKIIDRKKVNITYIHNKGMIIDNQKVLVSSVNGTKNSMKNNRELGIVVDGSDAADYYGQIFDFDWTNSGKLDFDTCELFRKKPPTPSPGDAGVNFVTAPGYHYLNSIFQFDPS